MVTSLAKLFLIQIDCNSEASALTTWICPLRVAASRCCLSQQGLQVLQPQTTFELTIFGTDVTDCDVRQGLMSLLVPDLHYKCLRSVVRVFCRLAVLRKTQLCDDDLHDISELACTMMARHVCCVVQTPRLCYIQHVWLFCPLSHSTICSMSNMDCAVRTPSS